MNKLFFTVLLFLTFSLSVVAGPQCQTDVLNTRISNSGGLYLSGSSISNGTFVLLCSVSQEANNMSVDACKSWLSILLAAQASDRKVDVSYKYADVSVLTSCANVPAASNAPTPYFVQLAD